ncbi:MAG TPA: bifunctional 5,10-methylenetetrahydrofolate dehydrogenase/5,10-methenyltetrahydrofolate cyclohydrolase [Blastocatellia bacterium]|jgi:methylenetetrahydrofolate dehydrogenase (NADP+)/methenyltetrahydrofolate cyclohydrolase|nr:bifunctional 5,10-methylenetetrahydrofolate dehydrogenase/5,10-methenyltetrahydrofolate cyclohydrolase [Blastocatellia bacterium]
MTAQLLDGAMVAKAIKDEVAAEVAHLAGRGLRPGLAAVLAGNDPASHIYVSNKVKACEQLGLYSEKIDLPETVSTEELLSLVRDLNSRPEIDGILIQLPLPKQVDTPLVLNSVDPAKDVDGFHPVSIGKLTLNEPGVRACTPAGIIEMLDRYGIEIKGARAVVMGRSRIVGLPMALLLLHRHATVTICHSRTVDLPAVAREADILVAAIGKLGMVDASYIKPGAAVIDVGTNRITDRESLERFFGDDPKRHAAFAKNGSTLIGDVNPREAAKVAGYLTPVPGGVGPLTIAMLMKNTLTAMKMRRAAD